MPAEKPLAEEVSNAPVVVELGKAPKKQIKGLMYGDGKLYDRVNHTIAELRAAGTISADAQPVIFVVKQKLKRKGGWLLS